MANEVAHAATRPQVPDLEDPARLVHDDDVQQHGHAEDAVGRRQRS